jgi:hypothetical protein
MRLEWRPAQAGVARCARECERRAPHHARVGAPQRRRNSVVVIVVRGARARGGESVCGRARDAQRAQQRRRQWRIGGAAVGPQARQRGARGCGGGARAGACCFRSEKREQSIACGGRRLFSRRRGRRRRAAAGGAQRR